MSQNLRRVISHNNHKLNWAVVGEQGGIHVWTFSHDFTSGGIEIHSREPLREGDELQHGDCWLIGGACHHDGSSLHYQERIRFEIASEFSGSSWPDKPLESLWLMLAYEYRRRFEVEAEIDFTVPVEYVPEAAVKATDALVAALTTFVTKYRASPDCVMGCGLVNGDFFAAERAIALANGGAS
jgi:hypothetical protein